MTPTNHFTRSLATLARRLLGATQLIRLIATTVA